MLRVHKQGKISKRPNYHQGKHLFINKYNVWHRSETFKTKVLVKHGLNPLSIQIFNTNKNFPDLNCNGVRRLQSEHNRTITLQSEHREPLS